MNGKKSKLLLPSFSVHRLVQEITRRQCEDLKYIRLIEALRWIDAAFAGEPDDVRDWSVLNPLLPHAQAVVDHADSAGITAPTVRLMNQLGVMYHTKSLYTESEPLMRRALVILIRSVGAEHPNSKTVEKNYIILLLKSGKTESEIKASLGNLFGLG